MCRGCIPHKLSKLTRFIVFHLGQKARFYCESELLQVSSNLVLDGFGVGIAFEEKEINRSNTSITALGVIAGESGGCGGWDENPPYEDGNTHNLIEVRSKICGEDK